MRYLLPFSFGVLSVFSFSPVEEFLIGVLASVSYSDLLLIFVLVGGWAFLLAPKSG